MSYICLFIIYFLHFECCKYRYSCNLYMNMDALVFLFQIKLLVSNIRIKIFARKSPASTFQAKKLLESFFYCCAILFCTIWS